MIKNTDLISLFEQSLRGVSQEKLEEVGTVVRIGDNVCTVWGLSNAMFGELVAFEGGNSGIIFQLDQDSVSVFLLDQNIPVAELEVVKRTHEVFKAPVGTQLIGRIISSEGK